MATFDAGSIDARLTLDRSPFAEGLRLARAEADDFESHPINLRVDLADSAELARLREQIAALNGKDIRLDVNTTGALELAHLRETIAALDGKSLLIDADISPAMLKIDRLRYSIDTLDAHANIDIDTATALEHLVAFRAEADAMLAGIGGNVDLGKSGGGVGGGGGSSGGDDKGLFGSIGANAPGLMLTAIATLAPIATAAVVPLTAALAGTASALTSAGTGVGVLALGVIPVITQFKKWETQLTAARTALDKTVPGTQAYATALAKVNYVQTILNEQFGPLVVGLSGLQAAWAGFTDATRADSMNLIVEVMRVLDSILPRLVPVFNAFEPAVSGMLISLHNFVGGPEMARFLTFVEINGPIALVALVHILGNLGGVFIHLAEAFAPFAQTMLVGLEQMTQRWDHWSAHLSDTQGFQDFIKYAVTQGPIMLDTLKQVADALIAIGKGMSPLAGPNMTALRILAETISHMPPDVITALAIGFEAWAVGMWAYTAATTAAAIATTLLDIAASPIILMFLASVGVVIAIVAALVALGIGIYELATKTQFFQTVWSAVWGAVKDVWDVLVIGFRDGIDALVTAWNFMGGVFSDIWNGIVSVAQTVLGVITDQINMWIGVVMAIWRPFWDTFGGLITATLNLIVAAVKLAFAILELEYRAAKLAVETLWNSIKIVFEAGRNVIEAVLGAIGRVISATWDEISGATSTAWNAVKDAMSGPISAARDLIMAVVRALQGALSTAWGAVSGAAATAWNGIKEAMIGPIRDAKSLISAAVDDIQKFFSGAAGWLVNAGAAIIGGLIDGITSRINDVKNVITGITGWIGKQLPGSPVREGPLRVLNDGYAGGQIAAMLAGGVNAKANLVRNAIGDLTDIAGMQIGGTGYINSRLGIAPVASTATTSGGGSSPDQVAALLAEMQAMREAVEEMTDEFGRQNNNMVTLARQGLLSPSAANR